MRIKLFGALTALLMLGGCNNGTDETLEPVDFASSSYTVYQGGEVGIGLAVVKETARDLSIPLTVEGPSGFALSADVVRIPAGELSGGITLRDVSLKTGDRIPLGFESPSGYTAGSRSKTVVTYDPREAVRYSFPDTEVSFTEDMELHVVLTGVRSGAAFAAQEEMLVPYWISGDGTVNDGSGEIVLKENGFVVPKGSNIGTGHLIRSHTTDITRPMTARLGVADFADSRYVTRDDAKTFVRISIPITEKKDKD